MCTCHCRWVQNSRDLLEECFCHHVTGWKPKCWCWLVSKPWSVVSRQPLAPSCRKLLNLNGRTITETNQQRQSLSNSDLCVSVLWACEEASSARPSHSSIDLFNSVVRRGSVAQEQQLRLQYKNKTKQNKTKKQRGECVCGEMDRRESLDVRGRDRRRMERDKNKDRRRREGWKNACGEETEESH